MRQVVCSGYTPQSSLCTCSVRGPCSTIRKRVKNSVRLDLEFRCPRKPYTQGTAYYVHWTVDKERKQHDDRKRG